MVVNVRYGGKRSLYRFSNVSSYDLINCDAFIYLLNDSPMAVLYVYICVVFFIRAVVLSIYSWNVRATNSGNPQRVSIDDDTFCE
jgi:hypothetical protein